MHDPSHRNHRSLISHWLTVWMGVSVVLVLTSCGGQRDSEVVIYSALDAEFSEPILDDLETELELKVLENFDVESTKTVGLVNRIMFESERPRCDVFWNNEILHTIRLQQEGLLQPFQSKHSRMIPAEFQADDGSWYGFAARARVLIVNTEIVKESERPDSVMDLLDPSWKGRVAIAKPLFGTTATHAAVYFASWGEFQAAEFFTKLASNARVLSGNRQVAEAVGRGELAFGLTDTDDAIVQLEKGSPVVIVFPDQGPDQVGTLLIPNTICIIKNGPNPAAAERLVERILEADIEKRLAKGASAQIPLREDVELRSRIEPETLKVMPVDFSKAARAWPQAAKRLKQIFE